MSASVPRNCSDPIGWKIDRGFSVLKMSQAWRCTPAYVYKLRKFDGVPAWMMARRMSLTFGWSSANVMDFWERKVATKKREAAA